MPAESAAVFGKGARVHFVGVSGAGMCGLADAMARAGLQVSGSDLSLGPSVDPLRRLSVALFEGHLPEHIDAATVVIRTAAVDDSNPEVAEALARGVPVLKRAAALGRWVDQGRVVAVAGTHGKTSTTTMATEILRCAGLDPSAFVGGAVRAWGGNFRAGADQIFVVEADEYDRSFLQLTPDVAIVTNVEADHLDIYGNVEGVYAAFRSFLDGRRPHGTAVVCGDDPGCRRVVEGMSNVVTYGMNANSALRVSALEQRPTGSGFDLIEQGAPVGRFEISMPGHHNVLNAVGAAGAARALGVEWADIREGLAQYRGVGRRFEHLGRVGGVDVLDDYAHHPTEVRATMEALRQAFPDRRLVALFQPHLFTRTRDFYVEFGLALSGADRVWITDVYPARERPLPGVTGALVADSVRQSGETEVHYHPDVMTLAEAVAPTLHSGDVCITLGAGSIERVGPQVVDRLKEA